MNTAKIKLTPDKKEVYIDGNFEFKFGENILYDPYDFTPIRTVTFNWCVEYPQETIFLNEFIRNPNKELICDEYTEYTRKCHQLLGDKLREDFLKILENGEGYETMKNLSSIVNDIKNEINGDGKSEHLSHVKDIISKSDELQGNPMSKHDIIDNPLSEEVDNNIMY